MLGLLLLSWIQAPVRVASAGGGSAASDRVGPNPGSSSLLGPLARTVEVPAPAAPAARSCSGSGTCARAVHPFVGSYVTEWYDVSTYASVMGNSSPPGLIDPSMAYDPGVAAEGAVGGVEVLFGGLTPWGPTNYTYVGVPATAPLPDEVPTPSIVWVNISSYVHAPSPRYGASMTYDAADGYVLLFGGQYGGANQTLGDTWVISVTYQGEVVNPPPGPATFRFQILGWAHVHERVSPSPRTGAGLTYDPVDNYTVLFGGTDAPTIYDDTWTYSAGTWTQLHPAQSPVGRAFAGFVFDQAAAYALLLPGLGSGPDAWGFAHGIWTPVAPSTPLGLRQYETAAYDNATGVVTAFGGQNASNFSDLYSDTWNFSTPPTWYPIDSYGPVARAAAAMAYDPQIGCDVLFGGASAGGWLNDTWLLCSWTTTVAPFTINVVPSTPVSDRPAVQAGDNASFTIVPSGGTWPYEYWIEAIDTTHGPLVGFNDVSSNGTYSQTFTFPISANYLISVVAEDSYGDLDTVNLTFPVGTVMVPDWQPVFDTYAFSNFRSAWSDGGNCYGFATTMILYWEHDVLGESETPYLPYAVNETADLREPPPLSGTPGPGMNSTTLAIMVHQTMDPGNSLAAGYGWTPADMAISYAHMLSTLSSGQVARMYLTNDTKAKGAVYHAVVVYGEQTLANGSIDLDVSNPNDPQATETALYDPTAGTFSYGMWVSFEVPKVAPVSTLRPSWFGHWTHVNSTEYDTQGHGYFFVSGLAPITVTLLHGGTDSFGDGGSLADSQTFVEGIANSSGIEEPSGAGTVQVFALPYYSDNLYTLGDPAPGSSPIEVLLATNVSGTPVVQGYDLNLTSATEHDFTLGLESDGGVLDVGGTAASVNVSFGQLIENASDLLNVTDLAFPAFAQATFTVLNWSGLNSSANASVVVRVVTDNGTGTTTEYRLTNGQLGLGAGTVLSVPVTFHEVGLPAGAEWSATVNSSTLRTSSTSLTFDETNGSYSYALGSQNTSWAAPSGQITVAGVPVNRTVTFRLLVYAVTFVESGLSGSTLADRGWTVVLNGSRLWSRLSTIVFPGLPNGTYRALVTGPSGYREATNGTVGVSGPTTVPVALSKGTTVTLTYRERGLPAGQPWSVETRGWGPETRASTLKLQNLTPGSYTWSVVAPLRGEVITAKVGPSSIPVGGSLNVSHSMTVQLTFAYPYGLTFVPSGLSAGSWSITLKDHTEQAAWNRTIEFNLSNGTYPYRVGEIPGYSSSGVPTPARVHGGPATVTVTFTPRKGDSPRTVDPVPSVLPGALAVVGPAQGARRPSRTRGG
jgi:hypothetical protein